MRRLSTVVGLVAFTAIACGDPVSVLPTAPSLPGVTSIELNGPATLAPGQSVQLTAVIRLADGTTKISTPVSPLQWFTSNSGILLVNSTGLLTATQQRGEARVTVQLSTSTGARSSSRDIIVLPDGTFRLVGVVRDAENPAFRLEGATVDASPGSVTATTDSDGRYRLYGVPADAVIRVTKSGYTAIELPVQLSTHGTRDFELGVSGSRVLFGGLYTVALAMDAGCTHGGSLGTELRRRVYEATLTQSGPVVEVVLTEPRFRLNRLNRGNRFYGYADSSSIRFTLESYDSYYYSFGSAPYPNVAELLSDGTFLIPQGEALVVGSPDRLSGGFNATFEHWGSNFPVVSIFASPIALCRSPAAQMTLTPR